MAVKKTTDEAAQAAPGTPYGTGTDPLGRYPKGVAYDPGILDDPAIVQAIEQGYMEVREEPIPAKPEPDVHEPGVDGSGAVRTDRPFTPAESAALDSANRAEHAQRRAERFVRQGRRGGEATVWTG